jgi:hypothetical protein
MRAAHGINIGHGYVKVVIIDEGGQELPTVVFPAMLAPAGTEVRGAIAQAATVRFNDQRWYVGEDALLSKTQITRLGKDRLTDLVFIPVLLQAALARLGDLNGASSGICVTGLPARWSFDRDDAAQLGRCIRAATDRYSTIRVIPEPLALVYSQVLDSNGRTDTSKADLQLRVGVCDLGHYTDDEAIVDRLRPVRDSLVTHQTGLRIALTTLRNNFSSWFERDFTLHEVSRIVRSHLMSEAQRRAVPADDHQTHADLRLRLPKHWDRPLIENGEILAARLEESWGKGNDLDAILFGGGAVEVPQKVNELLKRFPRAEVVEDPQLAIARGYAHFGRRISLESQA